MNVTILAGQYTKSFIKERVQEPRPYVVWLEKTHGLDDKTFYQLNRTQRGERVTALIADESHIPVWLKKHWPFETGFAFPSGRTLFAASWALLVIGLLWPRRHYKNDSAGRRLGGGRYGKPLVTGYALAARSCRCHRAVLVFGGHRHLACPALLWTADVAPDEQKEVAERDQGL